jgi:hypothetical protein
MLCRRPIILVLVVATAAVLAAGCGSGSSPGVANSASSTTSATATTQNAALAFARCLRAHGLPNWPDPTSNGYFDKSKLRQTGYSVSQVRAVELGPCKNVVPNSGGPQQATQQSRARLADELSFARCVRSHGVPGFPDPTAAAGLPIEAVQAQGIDVHAPAFLRIVQACLPASHGWLTPAKVREALKNAGG